MKCRYCDTEMYIDSTEVEADRETFVYKCPNPSCTGFGYQNRIAPVKSEVKESG